MSVDAVANQHENDAQHKEHHKSAEKEEKRPVKPVDTSIWFTTMTE